MPDVVSLQRAFADALTGPDVAAAPVDAFVGDADDVRRRLSLYRGHVQAATTKALRNAFPIVRKIVGDAFFDGLAHAYAARVPSASGDLNRYGEGFAAFVAGFPPAAGLSYLADVARLEWAVHRAHYAADVAPFDPSTLASIPPERVGDARLVLAPGCAVLASDFPLARLFEIHQDDYAGSFDVDIDGGPSEALVFRPRWRVRVVDPGKGAFALLAASMRGAPLAVALAEARAVDPGYTLDADLARFVVDRVVVDVVLDPR